MDILQSLVNQLTRQETREFKYFLARGGRKTPKKELQLFEKMRSRNYSSIKELLSEIYPTQNTSAFHHLRENLKHQLEEYIGSRKAKTVGFTAIARLISVAQHLFDRNMKSEGWHYILKAEKKAKQGKFYELLNIIYSIQIASYRIGSQNDFSELSDNKEANQQIAMRLCNMNIISKSMIVALHELHLQGKEHNVQQVMSDALEKYSHLEQDDQTLKERVKIIVMISRALSELGNFTGLEDYIIEQFELLESEGNLDKVHQQEKIDILSIVLYATTKNKKFAIAEKYLEKYRLEIFKYDKRPIAEYITYMKMKINIFFYQDKIELARLALEEMLEAPPIILDALNNTLLHLNMVKIYFHLGEYRKATKTFMAIQNQGQEHLGKLGKISGLHIDLAECIIQYELDNFELVISRLRSTEKRFKAELNSPEHQREKHFIKVLKKLNLNPEIARDKNSRKLLLHDTFQKPMEPGDSEIIYYNAWLLSKFGYGKYSVIYSKMLKGRSANQIIGE